MKSKKASKKGKQRKMKLTKKKSIVKGKRAATPRPLEEHPSLTLFDKDIIAEVLKVKPPQAVQPVAISKGVYQSRERHSAIVHRIGQRSVQCITMRNGTIENETLSYDVFADAFAFALPSYPMRRAARIYLNSFLEKSEDAVRVLRGILAS